MSPESISIRVLIGCFLLALITGCAAAAQETSAPEPTLMPTDTSIPPTSGPEPIVVTFDGKGCTVTGPAEVPRGNYPFIWNDMTEEQDTSFYPTRILDGSTFQDLLDLQSVPGEYIPKQQTLVYAASHAAGYYSDTKGVWLIMLDEPGEYYVDVGNMNVFWFCTPTFRVVEAPSD